VPLRIALFVRARNALGVHKGIAEIFAQNLGEPQLESAWRTWEARKDSKGPEKTCQISSFLPHAGRDYLMHAPPAGSDLQLGDS
jgi:hypothetical protein